MYIAQLVFDNDLRGDVFFPATTDWLNCFSTDACPIHNGYLSDSQRMLIRLRSVNYQGMIFHYPFYCVQKAVYMLADEHKNIKDQLLFRTNPSKAQK